MDNINTYHVLNVPISAVTLDNTIGLIAEWALDKEGRYVGVRDVRSLMVMSEDPMLLQITRSAALNLPDGMPLVWIGQRRGLPVKRTCGPDLFERMLTTQPGLSLRHFFYGGKPGVNEKLVLRFTAKNKDLKVVGTYTPPFRPLTTEEGEEVIRRIQESQADIVWVGMSSPKQDVWMAEHVGRLTATLIGVGAAFDFLSGEIRRAPPWMQRTGLEWAFRLASEPQRLWWRYMVLAPRFLMRLLIDNGELASSDRSKNNEIKQRKS